MRIAQVYSDVASERLRRKAAEAGFPVHGEASDSGAVRMDVQERDLLRWAELLADFVFDEWQAEYIARRLQLAHPYLQESEREYLGLLTAHGLRNTLEPEEVYARWRDRVRRSFADLCRQNRPVHVDGVVRFRLREYVRLIHDAVEESVHHYLADQEFEQFVLMLRLMLEAQTPAEGELHVYCADEKVWICRPGGELVHDPEIIEAACEASEDGEVNPEDLAMSLLITRAPERVVVHDASSAPAWPSFAETVERVFLDRAIRCSGCPACARLAGGGQGSEVRAPSVQDVFGRR
ncbi:MAG: putative sporulation protein YtxC [Alicyclobacillus sp.]|nr:putative sporulation protein YtxC [Alicyclobacillus sp.]